MRRIRASDWVNNTVEASMRQESIAHVNSNKRPQKLISHLVLVNRCYTLLCLCGCIWHIYYICVLYFKFETTSTILISRAKNVTVPSLSVCFGYKTLINKTNKGADLTVADILNHTPDLSSLMNKCVYRKQGCESVVRRKMDCFKHFIFNKFYKQDHICYSIAIKGAEKRQYNESVFVNSLTYANTIFEIGFPRAIFRKVKWAYVYIHPSGQLPRLESDYSVIIARIVNNITGASNADYFAFTYRRIETQLMTTPYDTNCFNYETWGLNSSDECYDECIVTNIVNEFKVVPYAAVTSVRFPLKHIEKDYMKNETLTNKLRRNEIKTSCKLKCSRPDCSKEYFIPMVAYTSVRPDIFSFRLQSPREPDVKTTFSSRQSETEFIVYLVSCFGFWFGLSVLNIAKDGTRLIVARYMKRVVTPSHGFPKV